MNLLSHIEHKQHIIWDWNGTLFNDVGLAVNTINQLLAEYELPALSQEQYKQQFGFPVIDFYLKIGFDFDQHDVHAASDRFVDIYMDNFHDYPLVDGARELLETISQSTKTQSILSAAEQQDLHTKLDHHNLSPLFDWVYGIQTRKADSKVGRGHELIEESNVAKTDTIIIGDTLHDLEVGKALGIDVILVDHGHQCGTRLRDAHHTVVSV